MLSEPIFPQPGVKLVSKPLCPQGQDPNHYHKEAVPQLFWLRQGAWPPPRQATRVRGDPTCQPVSPAQSGAEAMVKGTSAASKDTFPEVEVRRQTVLSGGLLTGYIVVPTKLFGGKHTEFVRLTRARNGSSTRCAGRWTDSAA